MVRQGERLLTLREAAKLTGLKPVTLRKYIKAGPLRATKLGRDWFVTPKDVKAYLAARRPVGRPRKED